MKNLTSITDGILNAFFIVSGGLVAGVIFWHFWYITIPAAAIRSSLLRGLHKKRTHENSSLWEVMLNHISPNKRQCCPSPYFNARRIVSSALRPRTGKPTHRAMF
jgi:hypothetical protein